MSSKDDVRIPIYFPHCLHDGAGVSSLVVRTAMIIATGSAKTVARLVGDKEGDAGRDGWGDVPPDVTALRVTMRQDEHRPARCARNAVPSCGLAEVCTQVGAALSGEEAVREASLIAVVSIQAVVRKDWIECCVASEGELVLFGRDEPEEVVGASPRRD